MKTAKIRFVQWQGDRNGEGKATILGKIIHKKTKNKIMNSPKIYNLLIIPTFVQFVR